MVFGYPFLLTLAFFSFKGGNFSTVSADTDEALEYDRISFANLKWICDQFGPEAGIEMLPATEYWECDPPSNKKIEDLKKYIPDVSINSFLLILKTCAKMR